jgi:IclR family acetate operon transcriptional repressor
LTRLANATGEAARLATLRKGQVIVIAQTESPERMAVNAHAGMIEPLHSTALERAAAGIEYTARTLTTPWALTENVGMARSAGYAVDDEVLPPEVCCIAVPAVIPGSRRFCAIGISEPGLRVAPARVPIASGARAGGNSPPPGRSRTTATAPSSPGGRRRRSPTDPAHRRRRR